MTLTFLGTGTSHGVPSIGCDCSVCTSKDPHDNRFRCSAYVECGNEHLLIDAGPEFRLQALREGIKTVDHVLITHAHADHLHGLDDLRIFSHKRWHGSGYKEFITNFEKAKDTKGDGLPVYANKNTYADIQNRFDYIFKSAKKGGGIAKLNLIETSDFNAKNPIKCGNIEIIPIPLLHGTCRVNGYLLSEYVDGEKRSIAYLTDFNTMGEDAIKTVLKNCGVLTHLVVDGLRKAVHQTHLSFSQSLEYASKFKAKHTWITHICHEHSHEEIKKMLDEMIEENPILVEMKKAGSTFEPAYDGLKLENSLD